MSDLSGWFLIRYNAASSTTAIHGGGEKIKVPTLAKRFLATIGKVNHTTPAQENTMGASRKRVGVFYSVWGE